MGKFQIEKSALKINNSHGDILFTDLRYPENARKMSDKLPVVVFCHGFKGFKDWGCFPYMLDRISEEGRYVLSFNFSYNGTGENDNEQSEFTRLELFARNTLTRELDDLGCIMDFIFENADKYNYDTKRLTLLGHSRGGGIAILKSAEDSRIRKLITLASVCSFDRYSDTILKKWKEDGFIETLNTRTNQLMRMNYSLAEDFINNKNRLDVQRAASEIRVPFLIIHGMQDISVDYSNAEDLYSRSNKDLSKLILLNYTGHTFGATHPFAGTTEALEKVISSVNEFI